MNECVIPSTRTSADNRWTSQHLRQVHDSKEAEPEILLIGDSIIQKMVYFEEVWSVVSSFHPLNLGVGGDTTQACLWRILNGALNEIDPKVIDFCKTHKCLVVPVMGLIIVLHIGTNNVKNKAGDVAEGVIKIITELQTIFPTAHIIFWGLLPRGERPNLLWEKNKEVNKILEEQLKEKPLVEIINSGSSLEQPDGTINAKDMYDYLHLTQQGYIKSFTPVIERIRTILNTFQ